MSLNKSAPIGIFDSGIGGLTVVKAVMEQLPNENIIYYGDTARVPYGIKSIDTIREYALQITNFLLQNNVKAILIACNSVAAAAQQEIRQHCSRRGIPVLDVVEAGTRAAINLQPANRNIGVIGTLATINSETYERSIRAEVPDCHIYSKACPLLVPLAEEGWVDNEIAEMVLQTYLKDFTGKKLDALILGCTHYPLFKPSIEKLLRQNSPQTAIIDSAVSIAVMTSALLEKEGLANGQTGTGSFSCFVSDKPQRFQQLAERFLGKKLHRIEISSLV
ncbi:MAG: glutamate racemase [Balneolales bacterium]|nr:glutamate racemase [Balneolales bacterium]